MALSSGRCNVRQPRWVLAPKTMRYQSQVEIVPKLSAGWASESKRRARLLGRERRPGSDGPPAVARYDWRIVSRVLLIHWNDRESAERVERLQALGFDARALEPRTGAAIRELRPDPPDAVVIDLDRSPTQGMAVAVMIRNQAPTRRVPIVFVSGASERVARVHAALPDAIYAQWDAIAGAIRDAIASQPAAPVVPGTMDAYSGTPLPRKLGLGIGTPVFLFNAPIGFETLLEPLPGGASVSRMETIARSVAATAPVAESPSAGSVSGAIPGTARLVVLFARSVSELAARFPEAVASLDSGGTLWLAWPKRASGVATDLAEGYVRSFGLSQGFVDFKIASIDPTWSGLRFARRSARGMAAHDTGGRR